MAFDNKKLKYDGYISIAVGKSRMDKKWKNLDIKWSNLLSRLSRTTYTNETAEEYKALTKEEQDNIKDVGGFVGGTLKGERRCKENLENRYLITLDADYATDNFWEIVQKSFPYGCCIYSTHKHSKENPRYRLVIPLKNPIEPDKYEALSRKVAQMIGIEYFDDRTYEASRLMYWPSTSKNSTFEFYFNDLQWIDADEILNSYSDWKDAASWPKSQRSDNEISQEIKMQGDPKAKEGIVGTFCRAYSIKEAIDTFLKDCYIPSKFKGRYTYAKGTASNGLVLYGDFAYSFHDTDPAGGKLLNAFDLVRIHKFSHLDNNENENAPTFSLPSFKAMEKLCLNDEKFKIQLGKDKLSQSLEDFKDDDLKWMASLEVDKRGEYKPTLNNIVLILQNDPNLKGKIAYNEFSSMTVIRKDLPFHILKNALEGDVWTDSDDAMLRLYFENNYGIFSIDKIKDGLLIVEKENAYHPIREYLNSLEWDGKKRVDTLLIDYFGAEDCPFHRAAIRKALCAAVARVFNPGIKFDYMIVLIGKQGIGKSYFIKQLGVNWYSDSLYTLSGREAFEQLQNCWIIEVAELSAIKRADTEIIKHFISKTEDIFRLAYDKRVKRFPRQCIFFGTTNDYTFLKDKTGNRRFWPVLTNVCKSSKNVFKDLTKYEVDQIWAEAYLLFKEGETLYLDDETENEAKIRQEAHSEDDCLKEMIREYLDMLLPKNWYDLGINERREYIKNYEFSKEKGLFQRSRVCAMEIWVELFGGEIGGLTSVKSKEINDILREIEGWTLYTSGTGRLRFGIYGLQKAFVREGIVPPS